LVIPWLESVEDRIALYGLDWQHATMDNQTDYIRHWLVTVAKMGDVADELQIEYYPARYHATLSSIFCLGDLCEKLHVPATNADPRAMQERYNPETDDESDAGTAEKVAAESFEGVRERRPTDAVCILEEPEHVNFYRAPAGRLGGWRQKFSHVVGIMHTNYQAYAAHKSPFRLAGSLVVGPLVGVFSAWMVRGTCSCLEWNRRLGQCENC
jgi:digalactosyldiacylglycerol synthase